ncbi:MAG: tRNA (adenosine(37)-N6)-threonylcarbamoyltransferase complex dimerization subunit type 1 TsaB [Legionellales bacterium]|nr:tRNA (adenosine(37)-N6)-threonylcarbamoyltransferase complex dimerization subunit type 1 TsaB [Legionellales bacterium]
MNILAFDTATSTCSVAGMCGQKVVEEHALLPRQQAQCLLPMIERTLAKQGIGSAQLDVIAFGRGPGSFTGLRIAASVAQGIAVGLSLPVIPISTLAALAQGAHRLYQVKNILVALDARMQQVYWGAYQWREQTMHSVDDEQVVTPAQLHLPAGEDWAGVGEGWKAYQIEFPAWFTQVDVLPLFYPHAQDIATLAQHAWRQGKAVAADQALPVYIRDKVT